MAKKRNPGSTACPYDGQNRYIGKTQVGRITYLTFDAEQTAANAPVFQYRDAPPIGLPAPASALLRMLRLAAGWICALLVLASLIFAVLSILNKDGMTTVVFGVFGILFGILAIFCLRDQ